MGTALGTATGARERFQTAIARAAGTAKLSPEEVHDILRGDSPRSCLTQFEVKGAGAALTTHPTGIHRYAPLFIQKLR